MLSESFVKRDKKLWQTNRHPENQSKVYVKYKFLWHKVLKVCREPILPEQIGFFYNQSSFLLSKDTAQCAGKRIYEYGQSLCK